MEKTVFAGKPCDQPVHFLINGSVLGQGGQIAIGGHVGSVFCCLGSEEGGCEEVGPQFFLSAGITLHHGQPGFAFFFNLCQAVLGHGGEVSAAGGQGRGTGGKEFQLGGVDLVAPGQFPGRWPVISRQWLEGLPGNATLQELWIEDTDQRVAHLDAGIEEAQWLAWFHGLQPQGGTAELHGQGIDVHPVDAAADDLAQGMPVIGLGGLVGASIDAGQLGGQAAGRGQKKMARTAGRVADGDVQQGLTRE